MLFRSNPGVQQPVGGGAKAPPPPSGRGKKFDAPVPLSEFAKRGRSQSDGTGTGTGVSSNAHLHTGHGRRDQLSAGERTRILRMLRDEGSRLADDDSQVYIGAAPGKGGRDYDFDFEDDSPVNPPPPMQPRPDVPAKPAVVVGLAQAQAGKNARTKRSTAAPPPPPAGSARPAVPPTSPPRAPARRAVPSPFGDEATRQVDEELLTALRATENQMPDGPRQKAPTFLPTKAAQAKAVGKPVPPPKSSQFTDEPTKMANIDARALDDPFSEREPGTEIDQHAKFLHQAPKTDPDYGSEEATRMANIDNFAAMERKRRAEQPPAEERTRAVNIRGDKSISDIDWDLD